MRKIDLVLTEVRELRVDMRAMNARIDALNGRVDTVIDALADLRSDFGRHTHD
ncbi:hypothetical protein [uncultured Jatrophihabitans sp.]|uniref:hypothetical protein n=1 Tax=uncultured Jatrophihabitans sp. TaxID=1610747 RepID=UPI0035CAD016